MRNFIIAGNWKMNTTPSTGMELAKSISNGLNTIEGVKVLLFPPATHFTRFQSILSESGIEYGSQNVHWETSGAYTAELSPDMLIEVGCKWTLIGHSERRQYFGETDETVNKRLLNVLQSSLLPIVCIGETLEERESNLTFEVLERQIRTGLKDVKADSADRIVLAYEPVWAIGTGLTASPGQAQEVHHFIRNTLSNLYSEELGESIVVQYGGSVKSSNAKELLSCPDVDGALIGGASLKAAELLRIIDIAGSLSR